MEDAYSSLYYPEGSQWVCKDNLACLTAPFWDAALADSSYSTALRILVTRSPAAVCRSMQQRWQIPEQNALAVWERYIRSFFTSQQSRPTVIVDFDFVTQEPEAAVERLASKLGLTTAAKSSLVTEIASHIRTSDIRREGTEVPSRASKEQRHLAEVLRTCAKVERTPGLEDLGDETPGLAQLFRASRRTLRWSVGGMKHRATRTKVRLNSMFHSARSEE